ncbi:unnamed protein product [Staurois parvus]|uniref:Uncharacterized protein n=1 Tax=Staurois parvus TaxID=386267 RepID=A0ABN9CJJ4_9NEOB|nr:unnamed protein product [Staurois parvus]
MTLQTIGDVCVLCASACADHALSFYMACHFVAELLLFPSCFHFVIIPLIVDRGKFSSKEISWMDLFAQGATYHGTTLEFTELLRETHSFTNVCRSLHAWVLDFIHLWP